MTFLSIFVPDFPVEAVLRMEPELRSQMVAVLEGKPPLQRVFALNESARQAGLELGMTRVQAEGWPGLVLRCRSAMQETTAHAVLLDCAQSFSPRVEDTAADTLVLDISGTEALFGPPLRLARDLAQRVSQLGLEANVAIACNPDAAIIAARGYSGVTLLTPENQQERLGHLPLSVLFASVPGEKNEAAQQFIDTLERWGVRTLRAFTALPEMAISERLRQKGVHLQKLARGTITRTLAPVEPPLVFEEAVELEHPLVLLEPLAFWLNRLLEQICIRLSARALATQEIRLKVELDPSYHSDSIESSQNPHSAIPSAARVSEANEGKSRELAFSTAYSKPETQRSKPNFFTRTLCLPIPMLDAKIFLKLLQLDLQAHPPGAPITKIWLSAEPARVRAGQGGLFVPPSPEPQKLELTMARISGIVGEGNVGSVELLDTHHPEGFRMRHFTPRDGTRKKTKRTGKRAEPPSTGLSRGTSTLPVDTAPAPEGSNNLARRLSAGNNDDSDPVPEGRHMSEQVVTALRPFRPPHLASVSMRGGNPARIACTSDKVTNGDILWQAGPWRSSGDWWEQEPWARDEWDIAVRCGDGLVLYRLVHDLFSGKWFVEGTYD
ncbi:MAG TPA: DNA polymerase Y family protein [Terriglobales bacterium]|nr:DNA polymerase Y family protein [Terriglobales bacterium]